MHTLLPNITFWSGKWSCFKVRVRVRAFFMSSTAYASTKGGKHFLDHKVTPTPEIKKKKKRKKSKMFFTTSYEVEIMISAVLQVRPI